MSRKVWKDNSPSIISESNTIPNGSLLTSILVIRVGCRGNLSKRNLSRFYYHCVTLTLPILDFTFPKVFHVLVDDKPKQRMRRWFFDNIFFGETFTRKALKNSFHETFR